MRPAWTLAVAAAGLALPSSSSGSALAGRVPAEDDPPVRIRPYVSTPRGVSLLNTRRIVRLCRGETVGVVLGYQAVRVHAAGFGGGRLTVVEPASGSFAWKLRARKGGRATLTGWDADGRRRLHWFRYSVRSCS